MKKRFGEIKRSARPSEVTLCLAQLLAALPYVVSPDSISSRAFLWISLIPLLIAIRIASPTRALFCGTIWSLAHFAGIYLASSSSPALSTLSVSAMVAAPAIYAWIGALATRIVGFNPLVLGVAWMGVELAIAPIGLDRGMMALAMGDNAIASSIAHTLGYVLVAFVVATVAASLVCVLGAARLPSGGRLVRASASDDGHLLAPTLSPFLSLHAITPSQPRAPPNGFVNIQ